MTAAEIPVEFFYYSTIHCSFSFIQNGSSYKLSSIYFLAASVAFFNCFWAME